VRAAEGCLWESGGGCADVSAVSIAGLTPMRVRSMAPCNKADLDYPNTVMVDEEQGWWRTFVWVLPVEEWQFPKDN
jgi:hypothetical protein